MQVTRDPRLRVEKPMDLHKGAAEADAFLQELSHEVVLVLPSFLICHEIYDGMGLH